MLVDKKYINSVFNNLEKFKNIISGIDYIHNKVDFFDAMKNFRLYLAGLDKDFNSKDFCIHKDYIEYKIFFSNVNEYYLRSMESIQSLSIIKGGGDNIDNYGGEIDKKLIEDSVVRKKDEFHSLNLSSVNSVAVVGTGSFSETLLYFSDNTNIKKLFGLDYNYEAIYIAGEMIKVLGLSNIFFKHMESIKYDYSNFDIIIISLFVPKKDKVIEQIVKTGKKGVQILVTNPKGFLNLIYDSMGEVNNRLKVSYREDLLTEFATQEIIKLEKYDF